MVTVQLLGGACLRAGDAALNGPPTQRHRIALLALIVASWPLPVPRDRAMALLWPERDLAHARRLLNLAVHVLRAALGPDVISTTGDGLLFEPATLRCDVHDLQAAINDADDEEVVRLYGGPLLDGFHLDDSVDFGYWLDGRRDTLARAYVDSLLLVAARQERAGNAKGRVGTCRRLVAVDPYSGAHAQALMRALHAASDGAGAIQHSNEHAHRRRVDLELGPDPVIMALADELRRAPIHSLPVPGPRGRTLAVLPFINLSADSENAYFADGITEDVIAQLSKIRALDVISRTSVMKLRERRSTLTLKETGAALGASILVDGSVRRAGDRVRVFASLLDVESDRQLWAETYDRQLAEIFSVQNDIALEIAAALRTELSRDEYARVGRRPTKDLEAYQLYQKGREWFIRFERDALARAIGYFERAVARDPAFALAYANLAMAHVELLETGTSAPAASYRVASSAAAEALLRDPELGAAYCTRGYLRGVLDLDWAGAELDFRRALELSPSSADTYVLYGRLCAAVGRFDEALVLQRRARELDPLAHRMDWVTTLLRAGRHAEAMVGAEAAVELDPEHDRVRATLGWAYFLGGRHEAGLAELERAVAMSKDNTMWLGQLGEAYAMAGDESRAREVLRQLEERARCAFVSPFHFAYVYTGLGEHDKAMEWLERAVEERTGPVYGIKGSFLLAALHAEPRFRALLERMNLV